MTTESYSSAAAAAAAAEEKIRGKKLLTEPKAWTLGNKQKNKKEKQQKKF